MTDELRDYDTWLPNPVPQAIALLDSFGNDMQAAFRQAEFNLHYAPRSNDEEFERWIAVAEVLQMPEVNHERWN